MYVCVFVSQFCVRDSFFQTNYSIDVQLGCGFKYFLFSPLFGEDSQFD